MAGPSGGGSNSPTPTILNNYAATVAPTSTDDASAGYAVGSSWLIPGTGDMFRCRSSIIGAARWVKVDPADHPGYTPGKFYAPFNIGAPVAGSNLPLGSKYFFFGTIKQRVPITQLQARLTTVSSGGNFGMGIYNHDYVGGRISTFVANTGVGSTGTAGPVNIALTQGQQFIEPGNYWFGTEADNATAVFLAVGPSSFNHLSSVGSPNGFGVNATTQPCGLSVGGQTFGTWPADLSGVAQSEILVARAPAILFLVPSP